MSCTLEEETVVGHLCISGYLMTMNLKKCLPCHNPENSKSLFSSSVSCYRSCFVCSGLSYEIYSGGGPSTYVYCVVCYRMIVAPYVRSVGHVFAYLYTLYDDSECPMDYETSLLPKAFPTTKSNTCSGILF